MNVQSSRAESGDRFGVTRVRTVGEIEASDIHASAQQPFDNARRAAGRPDSADNFGVAERHLFVDREIRDDAQEHLNAFVERCNGEALIVAVHTL